VVIAIGSPQKLYTLIIFICTNYVLISSEYIGIDRNMSSDTEEYNDNRLCGGGGGGSNSGLISSKKECTSCEQNNIDNITEDFNSMALLNDMTKCANCGKDDANNICNKCKQVKYCNAICKKVHKKKHKKECDELIRLAAEHAAMLYEEELFKQPPPDDCPICFLRLPYLPTGSAYMSCCGKVICSGCCHAPVYDNQGNEVDEYKCPFCRRPEPESEEEMIEREKKRIEAGDPIAIGKQGRYYAVGLRRFPRDYKKAFRLYHQAAQLGDAVSYCNIGYAYNFGEGVEKDENKAMYYYEQGAIRGYVIARSNLGVNEDEAGNIDRALKHYMIAARDGCADSVKAIKLLYSNGNASKEDYTKALQSYQEYLGEIKSSQRDKAAEFDKERYRYY